MARSIFPRTVQEFLDELDRRYPEPRVSPSDTDEDIRHRLAQREVFLVMRDAHQAAYRKDPDVFD